MNRKPIDTLVIGGGIAGIVTALESLELGRRVLLLDRDREENFGGLARESFGGMFFVDSPQQRRAGIIDSPGQALRDWHSVAQFEEDDHWPRTWAAQYVHHCTSQVQQWLSGQGIRFFPVVHWAERGLERPGNSVPRFHLVWGTGRHLADTMARTLRAHPRARSHLSLRFEHRVESLLGDAGGVQGARGVSESGGESFEVWANTTVVATGGIGGCMEKVRRHWYAPWGEPPEQILNGAHPFNDGRLHDAVQALGGAVTHLDWMWPYAGGIAHPRPRRPNHGLSIVPPRSALWLNWRGERLGPVPLVAGFDTRYQVERICQEQKKYSWQVLNLKIAHKEFAISGAEHNTAIHDRSWPRFLATLLFGNRALVRDMLENGEDFVAAGSIGELAAKMNALAGSDAVDAARLERTIADYDQQVAMGPERSGDRQLQLIARLREYRGDRLRTCRAAQIDDPRARPLIAIRERILSRKSLGGIQTDLSGRVLTPAGMPVPGLWAVGEAAGFGGGGAHGRGALEGTFLGGCVLTARVAAYAMSGRQLIDEVP